MAERALTISYTGTNLRIDRIQDPLLREVRYGYDAEGRLIEVTDPAGGTTRYTYDAAHRLLTITDARGITFLTNEYDAAGRVARQTQADGGVFTFGYTLTGSFISAAVVTDPRGHATTTRFNSAGYPVSVTDVLGQTTRFERAPGSNLVLSTTDPLGHTTSFTYDGAGNTTSVTDPLGNVTRFSYESTFNRLTSLTDALGQVTQFTHDPNGNLTATIDPLGARTAIAYNAAGQPITVTDALGHVTTFEYDAVGNPTATVDSLGNRTTRLYDPASRLIALTDPLGATTTFGYDPLNRVIQMQDPLGGLTRFGHDPNGNLLTVTDARGNTITYTYDQMDRVITRSDPLGRQERSAYDLNGNLTTVTDRKGQTATFTYDALDRQVLAEYADGSRVASVYDSSGRLATLTDSAAGTIEWSYDALNRLVRETTPQGSITYAYDAVGRRTAMTVGGQAPTSYVYDAASRLAQVAQDLQVVGLGYDVQGRRTTLRYPNGVTTSYTYDAASRLTSLVHQGPTALIEALTYQYDAAGHRVGVTRASGTATLLPPPLQAAYDAANEQVQVSSPTPNLTYDANGNLASQTEVAGTTTYVWDARNRLVELSGPGLTAHFTYDAIGRRLGKTLNGAATSYLYDGHDVIAEFDGAAVTTYLRSLTTDEPFVRQASGPEYYHADALGSVVALSDAAGTTQMGYRYEPFGATAAVGVSSNPFQYTGRENDSTGLYYYRARYFSPSLSRFLGEDPMDRYGSRNNLYEYVSGDPVNFADPYGLQKIEMPLLQAPMTCWPTNYPVVTGPFGEMRKRRPETLSRRRDPLQEYVPHSGLDARNPIGGIVYSGAPGIVKSVGHSPRGGNEIVVANDDGSELGYAHTGPTVVPGMRIPAGWPIGESDKSGTEAPHTHIAWRPCKNCENRNPLEYLPRPNSPAFRACSEEPLGARK